MLEATGAKIICEMGRYIAGNAGTLLDQRHLPQEEWREELHRGRCGHERPPPPEPLRRPSRGASGKREREAPLQPTSSGRFARAATTWPETGTYPTSARGDVLAVMSAGAYGFSMTSNYNSRRRPAEVLVRGDRWAVVREREHYPDLVKGELVPAFPLRDDRLRMKRAFSSLNKSAIRVEYVEGRTHGAFAQRSRT